MWGPSTGTFHKPPINFGWKELHNVLHNCCSSQYTIRTIKSGRIGWPIHVARIGKHTTDYSLTYVK
jgi:hypothetical protein